MRYEYIGHIGYLLTVDYLKRHMSRQGSCPRKGDGLVSGWKRASEQ